MLWLSKMSSRLAGSNLHIRSLPAVVFEVHHLVGQIPGVVLLVVLFVSFCEDFVEHLIILIHNELMLVVEVFFANV